ncbi:family 10 glycosylhydrolase [Massilibacteroides sp.]|uniref:glycoside hydrolase family 10 protein n=1 Tax=Massilibacteroides sp. TaxID=2034766 RepID=UPI0026080AA6|nr:family 10 glycosylhydrolase [Massilibacteroides sp.]MDD4516019.1 family 10 glycosylhydrolase [Massilibacteroides sp.]
MFVKYIRLFSALFVLLVTSCSVSRQSVSLVSENPKREFRGAWIQTAFQGEYKDMSPAEMKKSFSKKLDLLQDCGINAIIFQVRPEADAFYKSDIEPWSRFFTGEQGLAPAGNFDPMAFLIEECHKRNMEFHAWLNPYRASTAGNTRFADSHIYYDRPDLFVTYNKQILFDPGIPDNRQFICRVVRDIVSRYDVDAIHMDDYFYPYPVAGVPFPDERSFSKFGKPKGYTEATKADWRRDNVNTLISELKRTILLTKPWVRFGISPFGIYRNKKSTPDGSGSNTNGLQNYDDLYADVIRWTKEGWIDYNIPQIYWEIGHSAADYTTLINWWNRNANGGHLYIGQDVARTMKAKQLTQKMHIERSLSNVKGNCFWPANEILWNNGGVADSLVRHYHRSPALIPAYTHLHDRAPKEVKKLKAEWTEHGYLLHWEAEQSSTNPELASYFVIYRFGKHDKKDLNNPDNIITTTRDTYYLLPYNSGDEKYTYIVTAVDRFHNESKRGKAKKVKL